MRTALIGCGNIGADICIALQKGGIPAEIVALHDIDEGRANLLKRTFRLDATVTGLDEAIGLADFVVECAVADAVPAVVESAMRQHRDCLVMSVVGLMQHLHLVAEAREENIQLLIPSGALCGLDGIRAAMEAGLHSVVLTTRKPPRGLEGAPFLVEHNIDLSRLTEPRLLFEGNALEAARAFPANVNVAGALSIIGIGPKETMVRVIADPNATENIHEVVAEGAFGQLKTITSNLPSPRNAKSSYLASLSACAELRQAAMAFAVRAVNALEHSAVT